jgi:hypothetical protein
MSEDQLSGEIEVLLKNHFPRCHEKARQLLLGYTDKEAQRVRRGIVALSQGSLDRLAHYVERARQDYRDILYWAEYPDESSK